MDRKHIKRYIAFSLIGIAGLIAVATVHADYIWAGQVRIAAREISLKYSKERKVWFQGHWGFQYYMEQLGATPMNLMGSEVQTGDIVIIPVNNTALAYLNKRFVMIEDFYYPHESFLATMSPNRTGGFYASDWGPMPYVVETPGKDRYLVFRKTNK